MIIKSVLSLLAISYPFWVMGNIIPTKMEVVIAKDETIQNDLESILVSSNLDTNFIQFENIIDQNSNEIEIHCSNEKVKIKVKAIPTEWSASFYFGLQKLGFLFPHPRMSITPTKENILKNCGKKFSYKPAFKYRGFHLHTLHPSEWVHGFLMGNTKIANEYIKWLARNSQNIFDLSLVRIPDKKLFKYLKGPFLKAKDFGIYPGVALGAALHQQNSYKLLSLFSSITGINSEKNILNKLETLIKNIPFSFLNLESGTSEFTSVNYQRSISWMNKIGELLEKNNRALFTKVHVSSNQSHPKYGNFNFLPQYANKNVGVLPHTVMFYDMFEDYAPMYGNQNFHNIKDFTLKEMSRRPTWYYPETSYYIYMDIDVPLFLTDYLVSRARDMKELNKISLEGQINFTTGHELGYWLFDWTVALLSNEEYQFDPLIGLKLLNEDEKLWKEILDFQTDYIKTSGLISELSFANMQDELSKTHRIHKRTLLNEVTDTKKSRTRIKLLKIAFYKFPKISKIKSAELKSLLEITKNRFKHAYFLRSAVLRELHSDRRNELIDKAKAIRLKTQKIMDDYIKKYDRYPEAKIFSKHKNPTSYQFGYGYTTKNLILWKREEEQARYGKWSAFFMQPMDVFDIIF